ncbi:hypothetical protein ACFLVK_01365 [Chloroflexota bacterium]
MTPSAIETIKTVLQSEGITEVAIIDDAYDVPTQNSFRAGEINDFWAEIERDDEMLEELKTLDLNINGSEDINDATIQILWEEREKLGKLKDQCNNTLFIRKLQQLGEIAGLCKHLEELELTVIKFGNEDDVQDLTTKLIFIDYYLEDGDGAVPGQLAMNKIRDILEKLGDSDKPFIVLMSARGDVVPLVDKFCDETGVLKGLFDFVPKSELKTKAMLYVKLGTWAIGMPVRHKIQHFIDILTNTIEESGKKFISKIRGLSLEDYAYIQLLSLQKEEEPLGQYVLWLFASLLPHVAFEANNEVQRNREELDKLSFDQFLPSQRPPSIQLAEIYHNALSEATGELKYNAVTSGEPPTTLQLPELQFGDLFINNTNNKVWMVSNGPCDLIRATDPGMSILMIPGTLHSLSEQIIDRGRLRTELLEFEGKQFRIVWDHTNFISKRHGDIKDWVDREGCSRSLRLRLPFALQIQQKFATHLTRVGQPVPPPHYELVDIESYWEGEDGNYQELHDPIKHGAFIIHQKDTSNLVFTVECAEVLLGEINKVIERHERILGGLSEEDDGYQNRKRKLEGEVNSLRNCKEDCEILILLKNPLPFPFKKPQILKAHSFCLYLNGTFDGLYSSKLPISLNIKYGNPSPNANEPSNEVIDG